jgi:hypothetical protein
VHLHLTFEVNGTRVNACNYLPCNLAGWWGKNEE